jgi:hypothetical protein
MNIAIVDHPSPGRSPTAENHTVQELIEAHKVSVVALRQSGDAQDVATQLVRAAKSDAEKAHAAACIISANLGNEEALAVEGLAIVDLLKAVPNSSDEATAKAEYLRRLYKDGRNGPLEDLHLDALLQSMDGYSGARTNPTDNQ